jgi:hypothetical protein
VKPLAASGGRCEGGGSSATWSLAPQMVSSCGPLTVAITAYRQPPPTKAGLADRSRPGITGDKSGGVGMVSGRASAAIAISAQSSRPNPPLRLGGRLQRPWVPVGSSDRCYSGRLEGRPEECLFALSPRLPLGCAHRSSVPQGHDTRSCNELARDALRVSQHLDDSERGTAWIVPTRPEDHDWSRHGHPRRRSSRPIGRVNDIADIGRPTRGSKGPDFVPGSGCWRRLVPPWHGGLRRRPLHRHG